MTTAAARTLFGHLYVVLFANGLVKVGRAAQPVPRVAGHCAEGARHSNPGVANWVSVLLGELPTAERELIEWCGRRRAARLVSGAEWFHGLDYGRVVEQAARIVEPRAISPVTGRRLRRVDSCGTSVEIPLGPLVHLVPVAPEPAPLLPNVPSGAYARAAERAPEEAVALSG